MVASLISVGSMSIAQLPAAIAPIMNENGDGVHLGTRLPRECGEQSLEVVVSTTSSRSRLWKSRLSKSLLSKSTAGFPSVGQQMLTRGHKGKGKARTTKARAMTGRATKAKATATNARAANARITKAMVARARVAKEHHKGGDHKGAGHKGGDHKGEGYEGGDGQGECPNAEDLTAKNRRGRGRQDEDNKGKGEKDEGDVEIGDGNVGKAVHGWSRGGCGEVQGKEGNTDPVGKAHEAELRSLQVNDEEVDGVQLQKTLQSKFGAVVRVSHLTRRGKKCPGYISNHGRAHAARFRMRLGHGRLLWVSQQHQGFRMARTFVRISTSRKRTKLKRMSCARPRTS